MILYIDLIFLSNFLIDGALLLSTAWVRKLSVPFWRIAVSAAFGALYVVMMLFPPLSFLFTLLLKCLFAFIMMLIAFGFGSLQYLLRNLGVFYLLNFAAAGGILGIHFFMQTSGEVMNGIWFGRTGGFGFTVKIGFYLIAVGLVSTIWLYKTVFSGAKQRAVTAGYIADVRVEIDGTIVACKGLLDTGNQLYDPLTRTPVMVVEAAQWKAILPESWLDKLKRKEADRVIGSLETEDFVWRDRLRLVPFRGINGGTQFMLALKPDKVVIDYGERRMEATKVLIALDAGKLCADGSYQAIIHPMLVDANVS